jgi:hypothetical protein
MPIAINSGDGAAPVFTLSDSRKLLFDTINKSKTLVAIAVYQNGLRSWRAMRGSMLEK